jgi:multifunctional beta-oxidation protein
MGGWAAQTRWQRAGGHGFPHDKPYTIEDVFAKWDKITKFNDGRSTNPTTSQEAFQQVLIMISFFFCLHTEAIIPKIVENFSNVGEMGKAKL